MKTLLSGLLILFSIISVQDTWACANDLTRLTVNIGNIENRKGSLFVAVHNSPSTYLSKNKDVEPFRNSVETVGEESTQTIEFCDLPFGQYAITVFLDLNGNGDLDSGFMGIPKEPYGFSNVEKSLLAPSFEKALITYTEAMPEFSVFLR